MHHLDQNHPQRYEKLILHMNPILQRTTKNALSRVAFATYAPSAITFLDDRSTHWAIKSMVTGIESYPMLVHERFL